jgi:hypothetical protein
MIKSPFTQDVVLRVNDDQRGIAFVEVHRQVPLGSVSYPVGDREAKLADLVHCCTLYRRRRKLPAAREAALLL